MQAKFEKKKFFLLIFMVATKHKKMCVCSFPHPPPSPPKLIYYIYIYIYCRGKGPKLYIGSWALFEDVDWSEYE